MKNRKRKICKVMFNYDYAGHAAEDRKERSKELERIIYDLEKKIEAMDRGDVPFCDVEMFELREAVAMRNNELDRLAGRSDLPYGVTDVPNF